jgi:DNA-binding NarL/FixJ family response regulator
LAGTVEVPKVRIVLADDERLIRAGLSLLLAAEPDLDVVGETANGGAGFLLKNSAPQTLTTPIRALAKGEGWLDPAINRKRKTDSSAGFSLAQATKYCADHGKAER